MLYSINCKAVIADIKVLPLVVLEKEGMREGVKWARMAIWTSTSLQSPQLDFHLPLGTSERTSESDSDS